MSKYLFIDTETTGLPINQVAPPTDLVNWHCRLVSIGYILSEDETILEQGYFLIKPNGFIIPQEAIQIHGITTSDAILKGVELREVLVRIKRILSDFDPILVGHNIEFDVNVIDSEFFRINKTCPLNLRQRFCTMLTASKYCKLNREKYPKLKDLYFSLYGEYFENQHNSFADIDATFKCFWMLKNAKSQSYLLHLLRFMESVLKTSILLTQRSLCMMQSTTMEITSAVTLPQYRC